MNKCSVLRNLVHSHHGAILVEVVHRVLEEYDLTQKLSNFFPFFSIINLKPIGMNFLFF